MDSLKNAILELKQLIYECRDELSNIFEHADKYNEVKTKIRDLTPNIFLHLYKIYGFGEYYPQTIHHWCSEILANLLQFCNKRIKATNKALSTEDILKIIKDKYRDSDELGDIVGSLYLEYGYSEKSDKDIYNQIMQSLPSIINYVKSNERPSVEDIEKLL